MDKKLENNIINCSRCGLCMEVCPVYKTKLNETSSLRGKFLQLLGLIKGDLKYDKKIAYNLDLCLACKKCKSACPSGLDALEIFCAVRGEFQSPFENVFYSEFMFKLKMLAINLFFKFLPKAKNRIKKYPQQTGYFKGCATKAIYGEHGEFSCCGLPFYIKGKRELFEKYKNQNLKLFKKYNKIVFDCASCYDTVMNYSGVDKSKLIYFTDFYKNKNLEIKASKKAVFHKPCHMDNKTFNEIKQILKSIKNLDFVEFDGQEDCCGFGGDFFSRHIKTALYLSKTKTEKILKTNADIVLTSCPSCLWSLQSGIKILKAKKLKAYDLAEFLYKIDN